jgi:hypothetical protein
MQRGIHSATLIDKDYLLTYADNNDIAQAALAIEKISCPDLPAKVAYADLLPDSQNPENAHWHAMRNGKDPNSTVYSARQKFDEFVNNQWELCSCDDLARVLHAVQDSYARGHRGFQLIMITLNEKRKISNLLRTSKIHAIEEIDSRLKDDDVSFDFIYDLIFKKDIKSIEIILFLFKEGIRDDVLDRFISGPLELAIEIFGEKVFLERIKNISPNNLLRKIIEPV